MVLYRPATRGGAIGQLPPQKFLKPMYLLGTSTSYIILPNPRKYQLVAALVGTLCNVGRVAFLYRF